MVSKGRGSSPNSRQTAQAPDVRSLSRKASYEANMDDSSIIDADDRQKPAGRRSRAEREIDLFGVEKNNQGVGGSKTASKGQTSPRTIRSRSPDSRSFFSGDSIPMKKPDSFLKLYDSEHDESEEESAKTNSTVNSKEKLTVSMSDINEDARPSRKTQWSSDPTYSSLAEILQNVPDDTIDPLALFERDSDAQRRRRQASPSRRASDVTLVGQRVRLGEGDLADGRSSSPDIVVRVLRTDSTSFDADRKSADSREQQRLGAAGSLRGLGAGGSGLADGDGTSSASSTGSAPQERRRVRFSLAETEGSESQLGSAAAAAAGTAARAAPAASRQPAPSVYTSSPPASSPPFTGTPSSAAARERKAAAAAAAAAAAGAAADDSAVRSAAGGGGSYMARMARALARSLPCTSPRVAG